MVINSESHEKLVAVLHLIHGFVAAVAAAGVFLSVALLVGFKTAMDRWVFPVHPDYHTDPEFWLGALTLAAVAVYVVAALLFTVPSIAGGFGMLKRKRWARKLVLVSAAVAAFNFPLGTGLAVYTFWLLLGKGRGVEAERSQTDRPRDNH